MCSWYINLTHTAAVYHSSAADSPRDMPADGTVLTLSRRVGQVVTEGAGRGGTSAGRGGVHGTHGGHPGTLGAVAQPLAAERLLTWCRAPPARRGHRGSIRLRYLGFSAIKKRLLQAIDHVRQLISQSDRQKGQSQVTLLRMGLPSDSDTRVRAPKAVVLQDGLGATSPQDKSWRSVSGGSGKPSGVAWRPRWRPPGPPDGPDAHWRARTQTPVREKG